jgi:anhydro-N-acetylmuramic acid kinase
VSKAGLWQAVGLMSGTSGDGIDAALIRTDGEAAVACGPALSLPYEPAFRGRLHAAYGTWAPTAEIAALEAELTRRHGEAVAQLLALAGIDPATVDVIGFHGQTLSHDAARGRTWQIGDGPLLAAHSGIDVVFDLRGADMAAGGQGAPLVPVYHQALAAGLPRPLAVVNIGGVANVTWLPETGGPIAFDTGPGNGLLDDWIARHTGEPCDRDGALAAAGAVDSDRLGRWLDHPYFRRPAPKSLDRLDFAGLDLGGLSLADGAATLTAFTARSIARAVDHLPAPPARWLVTGGGRRNPSLMAALAAAVRAQVQAVEEVGWDGDALEAQAFAYLAVRSRRGLPLTFPGTTGVPRPTAGGRYAPAPQPIAGGRYAPQAISERRSSR